MLWIYGVIAALLVGIVLKIVLDGLDAKERVSWAEFLIAAAVCAVIVVPITVRVGNHLAQGDLVRYNEFWGGYETAANHSITACSRDGSCSHTYNCDPYEVTEVVTVPDADGKGSHTEVQTHTEYHSCPEVTEENTFTVDTTLGTYTIATGIFDASPHAWRGGHGLSNVERGVPSFWAAAKARLDAHNPGPVTAVRQYDNYILASSHTILKKYSDEVDHYNKLHMLPPPVNPVKAPIHDWYYADKMAFVHPGVKFAPVQLSMQHDWQVALMHFNAALGADLQGDLHIVVVDSSVDPDKYTGALNAWWQDKSFGRNALSKNGIALVVGEHNGTIDWARGFTGMPIGNTAMLQDFRNLKGLPLTPEALLGTPVGQVNNGKVTVTHTNGALENIVWGPDKFKRICMKCKTTGGGYTYLKGEIQPTSGQKWTILAVGLFLSCIIWAITLFTAVGEHTMRRPARSVNSIFDRSW